MDMSAYRKEWHRYKKRDFQERMEYPALRSEQNKGEGIEQTGLIQSKQLRISPVSSQIQIKIIRNLSSRAGEGRSLGNSEQSVRKVIILKLTINMKETDFNISLHQKVSNSLTILNLSSHCQVEGTNQGKPPSSKMHCCYNNMFESHQHFRHKCRTLTCTMKQ